MKIIKNINNNFAIAIDNANNQLIVSGKGIGFGSVPREVHDLNIINRTFYNIDDIYVSMINSIPEEIFDISVKTIDYARTVIKNPFNSNIVFTLADHINFSIERNKKNLSISLPIIRDIQHLFEEECKVGSYALELINERLNIELPDDEAKYIALHIVNSEEEYKKLKKTGNDEIINEISKIIEKHFNLKINKDTVNFSRFVSHMHYLIKRGKTRHLISSNNDQLYKTVKSEYPDVYVCSEEVANYINEILNVKLSDEEKLYLILHINRLCERGNETAIK
jgi:beta-glucoside operon transcriptional antiterminator